jgi:bis(5'-nucleosyl)-tetraphosphatase (symmetrical)
LGNHDLHLLAIAYGAKKAHRSDTVQGILDAADRPALLDWLRHQRMACFEQGWLMVHAGVLPQWTLADTLARAGEVETMLRGPGLGAFVQEMYGNEPGAWDDGLSGMPRLRCIVNALTRLRFVDIAGRMDFKTKDGADGAPPGFFPWFDLANRRTLGVPIAFGHWSTLGLLQRRDLLALDTGCVWGGRLTAAKVENGHAPELISVKCEQSQKPG